LVAGLLVCWLAVGLLFGLLADLLVSLLVTMNTVNLVFSCFNDNLDQRKAWKQLCSLYGENFISDSYVRKLYSRFRRGYVPIGTDSKRSGFSPVSNPTTDHQLGKP